MAPAKTAGTVRLFSMNDHTPDPKPQSRGRRCGWIVLGCVVFGILMGGRAEFQSVWVRSLVAWERRGLGTAGTDRLFWTDYSEVAQQHRRLNVFTNESR